jgi:hypothetical protein
VATKRVWRQALSRWHTAKCVHVVPQRPCRSAKDARRGMPTVRCYDAIAGRAGPAYAALPPTLRSGGRLVVLDQRLRLPDVVRLVSLADGPPGAACRQSDPPRPVERPTLYGMPPTDDGGPGRHTSGLPRRDARIRPAQRPADGLTRLRRVDVPETWADALQSHVFE